MKLVNILLGAVLIITGVGILLGVLWVKMDQKHARILQGADMESGLYNVGECFTWPSKDRERWDGDDPIVRISDIGLKKYRLQIHTDRGEWIDGVALKDLKFDELHRMLVKTTCPVIQRTQGQIQTQHTTVSNIGPANPYPAFDPKRYQKVKRYTQATDCKREHDQCGPVSYGDETLYWVECPENAKSCAWTMSLHPKYVQF